MDACFGSLNENRICFPRKRRNLPKPDVRCSAWFLNILFRCLIEGEALINGQDGLIFLLHDQIFRLLHEKQWVWFVGV